MLRRLPIIFPWLSAAILLAMFGLAVTSMAGDALTFDEQGFLVRGLAYLRGDENGGNRSIRVGHPLGLNALNAALLVNDPGVVLPSDDPSWLETSFHRPAELFLWEIGNDVAHIVFQARIPTIWLGMLLAALCARWAADIGRGWGRGFDANAGWVYVAALATLLLVAFDPNIQAHTRLVTTDLGLTAGAAMAGYTVWRFARFPSWRSATLAGIGIGLMLNTKFTSLIFIVWFGLVVVIAARALWRGKGRGVARQHLFVGLSIIPFVAFLTLWAGHGFEVSPLKVPLPFAGDLNGLPVPLADYLTQLLDIGNRLAVTTPSFLLGQYSDSGWWYYFPVAFVLKTPLPVLLLLVWSAVGSVKVIVDRKRGGDSDWFDLVALLVPAGGFFTIALTTDINLGYRHLLPVLPFLFVFIGVVVSRSAAATANSTGRGFRPGLFAILMGWFLIASLWIYPHYLAFFNILAGGPDNGWKYLVDSNLDWGQDLGRLSVWLDEHGIEDVWLSYFGEARPEYYGISYRGLDSFPPRLMNPQVRPFYPHAPAPGWYAISATTLQGVHFTNHDLFTYFRDRKPNTKIGNSIFIFEEPAYGVPVDLILGNIQVDQIAPDDYALFNTNDVTLRWVDPGQAFILPGTDRTVWAVLGGDINSQLADWVMLEPERVESGSDMYRLYRVLPGAPIDGNSSQAMSLADGEISFIGAQILAQSGDSMRISSTWQQNGAAMPVKIFIHVLNEAGDIVTQWDGLGAAWEGWREGDTLFHIHELPLDQLAEGNYRVVIGLYDPENFRRWQDPSGRDVIELGNIAVP